MLLTGALSSAFSGAPATASAPARPESGQAAPAIATRVEPAPPSSAPEAAPSAGDWQIQVGAFRNESSARTQLRAAESLVPELASLAEAPQPWGDVVRARFGGIADEAAASGLCGRIIDAGGRCFVVAPGG